MIQVLVLLLVVVVKSAIRKGIPDCIESSIQLRFLVFFVDSQPSTDVLAVFRRHGDSVSGILSDFKLNATAS